jgi:predicted O-methyltransferase YrrM
MWKMMPSPAKQWLKWRVFEPGERLHCQSVGSGHVLAQFCSDPGSTWAITPSAMLLLWHLLHELKPRNIVEFGSGVSTRIFASYAAIAAKDGDSVRILSIDHDRHWLEETRRQLGCLELDHHVRLVHAPLTEQQLLGRPIVAYSVPHEEFSAEAGTGGFDFCLIDGPPGEVGRAGSLPLAAPHLSASASIILDDAYRPGEQLALKEWYRSYKGRLSRPRLLLVGCHGLGIARWKLRGIENTDQVSLVRSAST